ncbi:WxcM-like domain-containing protein [Candidatus Woesebacteria bacterium]|nr:WxcM-like domain-containing protein [Candidatus Woesebacteria bacterium]
MKEFEKHSDGRGDLIVFLKGSDLDEEHKIFGQIYFVTFEKKGIIRGNHYHNQWREWFGIVAGKVEVYLEDIDTKERITLILDAKKDKYTRLEIGPHIAHTFRSLTNYAALINYANSEWYANDTIPYNIEYI